MNIKTTFDQASLLHELILGDDSINLIGIGACATNSDLILSDLGSGLTEQIPTSSTTAFTVTVSSASANDTAAGTGARTVLLSGLDANWNLQSETITLNGQTGVTSANSYIFVNTLQVITSGSGGTNAGIIYIGTGTITAGVPATKYVAILAGYGISRSGFFAVPANYNFVLRNGLFKNSDTSLSCIIRTWVKPYNATYVYQVGFNQSANTGTNLSAPFVIPPQSIIKATGNAPSGTPTATVFINGFLTSNQ